MNFSKYGLRSLLLVAAGILGGIACDQIFKNNFPIFSILLPIMALSIAWHILKESKNEDEEAEN